MRGRNQPSPQKPNKLAKALGVEAADLLPNQLGLAVAQEAPTFQIQKVGDDGKVWLHVNQHVNDDQTLRVMAILNEKT